MSNARTKIVKALSEAFKAINGRGPYKTNITQNSFPKLKFWDEVHDFPCIYTNPGIEHREYLPGGLTWGKFVVIVRAYVKQENPQEQLEDLLSDLEYVIDNSRNLVYDETVNCGQITDMTIASIITDEGLLDPYGIAEVTLNVQYQVI